MTLALALAAVVGAPPTFDLRYKAAPGKPIAWNVVEERTEGGATMSLGTKVLLLPGSGSANLTLGPFTTQGRTFGRPKARSIEITPQATLANDPLGRPPFVLSIPLPGKAVKTGAVWSGVIVGPTPMPAGVKVTFKAVGTTKIAGMVCVRVVGKIATELGGAKITGGGEWAVRLTDGLAQKGSLTTLLVYRRPDPVTRKMTESARVNLKATITRT